jgi:hypothetical protein
MEDLVHIDDCKDDDVIHISSFPFLGKNVLVRTTHGMVTKSLEKLKQRPVPLLKDIYRKVYSGLIDVNVDQLAQGAMKGEVSCVQRWDDFCADVSLLACLRLILFEKPIPIQKDVTADQVIAVNPM